MQLPAIIVRMNSLIFSAAILALPSFAGTLEPGQDLDEAIGVHITKDGLMTLGDIVEGVMPNGIPVTDISGEQLCSTSDQSPLAYTLGDMEIYLTAQSVELDTSNGILDFWFYMTMSSTATTLDVSGDCTFLTDLEETCGVELPVTAITVHLPVSMEIVDDAFEVVSGDLEFTISPIGNILSDCILSDAIGTLLNQNENAISDMIYSLVAPALEDASSDIDTVIEEALEALNVSTDLSIGEATLGIDLYPSALTFSESGMGIGLGARISAPDNIDSCVAEPGAGSDTLGGSWPVLSDTAPGSNLPYDIGLLINRDFVDHLLWNVWAAGGLCIDLSILNGVPVNTDLIGTFLDDEFHSIFPLREDAQVEVVPGMPPLVEFYDDAPSMGVLVEDLFVELYANLDGRRTRIFQTSMGGEVGFDPGITSTMLAPELIMDDELFVLAERWSDLLSQGYAAGLSGFVDTVLATDIIPTDILPTMSLPTLMGAGIDGVFWIPTEDGQWQGGYILLDTESVVPIEAPGCSGDGALGCDASSDDLLLAFGCSSDDPLGCGGESSGCGETEGSGCGDSGCSSAHTGRLPWPVGRWFIFGLTMCAFRVRRR